jgi:prepilin-type N-terminal cleavage/methylation domain-containing protein
MKNLNISKGFTLIELSVVMVIIAALSVVALPSMTAMTGGATSTTLDGIKDAMVSTNNTLKSQADKESLHNGSDNTLVVGTEDVKIKWGFAQASVKNVMVLANFGSFDDVDTDKAVPGFGTSQFQVEQAGEITYVTFAGADHHVPAVQDALASDATDEQTAAWLVEQATGSVCYISYEASELTGDKPTYEVYTLGC